MLRRTTRSRAGWLRGPRALPLGLESQDVVLSKQPPASRIPQGVKLALPVELLNALGAQAEERGGIPWGKEFHPKPPWALFGAPVIA